jgi:acylphosphatase
VNAGPSGRRESLRALVRGRVQGVGFRAFVVWKARELSLKGFARNLSDGTTVEVVAEGSRVALETLLTSLREGPPMSYVKAVDVTWGEASGVYEGFGVR